MRSLPPFVSARVADWDLQPRRRFRKFSSQSSATVGNHEYISSKFFAIFFFYVMFTANVIIILLFAIVIY